MSGSANGNTQVPTEIRALVPRITSPDELSGEVRDAVVALTTAPGFERDLPETFKHQPEAPGQPLKERVLVGMCSSVARVVPLTPVVKLSNRVQSLATIGRAEREYAWLKETQEYIDPAIEALKHAQRSIGEFLVQQATNGEKLAGILAGLKERIAALMTERAAIQQDLQDERLRTHLDEEVGRPNRRAVGERARGRHHEIALEVSRHYREAQFIAGRLMRYANKHEDYLASIQRIDAAIGTASRQLDDVSEAISVYEVPTRAAAAATVALQFLQEVGDKTGRLKESMNDIHRNLTVATAEYVAGEERYEAPHPVDVDLPPLPDQDELSRWDATEEGEKPFGADGAPRPGSPDEAMEAVKNTMQEIDALLLDSVDEVAEEAPAE